MYKGNQSIDMLRDAIEANYKNKTKDELIFSLQCRNKYVKDVLHALSEKEVKIFQLEEKLKLLSSN